MRILFLGEQSPLPCGDLSLADAANRAFLDHNGDGELSIADPVATLVHLFLGGPPHVLGSACRKLDRCPELCQR